MARHPDGLNRYDGHEFKVWKTDADDPLTLSDAYITCFAEDPDGNLWVGSEASGFAHFDRVLGEFDFICNGPPREGDQDGANYEILDLVLDEAGVVWMGTRVHGLLALTIPRAASCAPGARDRTPCPPTRSPRCSWARRASSGSAPRRGWSASTASRGSSAAGATRPAIRPASAATRCGPCTGTPDGGLWVGTDAGLDRYLPESDGFEHHLGGTGARPSGIGAWPPAPTACSGPGAGRRSHPLPPEDGECFAFGQDLTVPDYIPRSESRR